ncbi:MAG: branched-chain amino acid ABC transporter permease [Thermodesulfobacteriota bacterium]
MELTIEQSFSARIVRHLRSAAGLTILGTIVLLIAATLDRGAYILVNTIVTGGMWALMSMGLALVFGVMNIAHFAIGEMFMAGGLFAFFVVTPINDYLTRSPQEALAAVAPLVAILCASLGGAVIGVVTELFVFRPLRRRSREQWIMNTFLLTLGLSMIMINGHQLIFGTEFKGIVNYWNYDPIATLGTFISFDRAFAFVCSIVVMIGFWLFMKYTLIGQAIRAVSQDERGALMVGINLNTIQTLTMALSCGLAALAGACLLFMFPSYPTVGLGPLYNAWFVVIVVGLGNVAGTVVGGFMVAMFQILTTIYVGEGWGFVIPSILIIVILVFKPSGLFGTGVRSILDQ